MSTVPLSHGRAPSVAATRTRSRNAPIALAAGLLLVVLYAAFEHGAVALASEARLQVAIAAILAATMAAWLWTGALSCRAPRSAIAGASLLVAFAVWSAISLAWSVAPNQTWIEFNLDITYVLVLVLAIILGSSTRRAWELVADGFLVIGLAVTVYALGQKVLPGLHVSGVFDLNQTTLIPRLQEPLGYWNALALFVAYGTPLALARATDTTRSPRMRSASLVGLQLMLIVIGLTYSRGGVIALVVGIGVGVALSGERLRSLMWLAVGVLAAVPPLVYGLASHSLSAAGVSLDSRETAGLILFGVLLVSSVVMLVGAGGLRRIERDRPLTPAGAQRMGRVLAGLLGAAVIAALLAVTFSGRGLTGTFSHAWKSFTTTHETSITNPERLLSASSENRWVWWKEAAGAFSDKPVAGWGAGSFPVVHLLYRRNRLSVNQPHSVPLQFLAETGLIGTALAVLAFILMTRAGTRRVLRTERGRQRLLGSALLAGTVMFFVHSLYDWDWDIPAMAIPALMFLGVLLGSNGRPEAAGRRPLLRAGAVAMATLCAALFATSAVLPSLSASKANQALVEAAGSPSQVAQAQSTAQLASRLDPLSDAGLRVEATVAGRRGEFTRARQLLVLATERNPSDITAWSQLTVTELVLRDKRAALQARRRARALDPIGGRLQETVAQPRAGNALRTTPPRKSATARPVSR